MGLVELLELQKKVREECRGVCFDTPVTRFDCAWAQNILEGLHVHDAESVDVLRWLVDYFYSCQIPFPRGVVLDEQDRQRYSRLLRRVGDVEEVNRFLLIEQNPYVLRALARFVKLYNAVVDAAPVPLEREKFSRDVSARGLALYLQQKVFSQRVIEESLHRGNGGVLEISRGQRSADMAYDEKMGALTRVRNYEKMGVRSIAQFKRALADAYLREYPDLEVYYDIPEPVKHGFLHALKMAYMTRAAQHGFRKLEDVFVGFDLELYLSSARLSSDDVVRRELDTLYGKFVQHGHEVDYQRVCSLLLRRLEEGLCHRRSRAVFLAGNSFGIESWMNVADLHRKFYLGKDAWRKKLRRGDLQGTKEAIGKYVAVPKAGRWRASPASVEGFQERYACDGVVLVARNLRHLSRVIEKRCFTLSDAARLSGMPEVETLRNYVQGNNLGYRALIAGMGERRVILYKHIRRIRKYYAG